MELTPAMKQFVQFKKEYKDSILLFRMGDFYETFFEDAKKASKILGITLTKRGKANPVPLAGIPYHALDNYLQKLVKAGECVTIVEQMEDPKLAKGRIVKRDVVRTITPGTIIEDNYLDSKTNNYIVSLFVDKKIGISIADISTGEFRVFETTKESLIDELIKINPAEIIMPESYEKYEQEIGRVLSSKISLQPMIYFSYEFGEEEIKEHFNIANLKTFEIEDKPQIVSSAGALLNYLKYTQKARLRHINKIKLFHQSSSMVLDIHTIKNLELIENLNGSKASSLINTIDRTKTPMGARLLKRNILSPLQDKKEIENRFDRVEKLIDEYNLESNLQGINDTERIISKIMYGVASPRDLHSLKESIYKVAELSEYSKNINFDLQFELDSKIKSLAKTIDSAIDESAPIQYKEGGFIKAGFNEKLDELNSIKTNSKDIVLRIESNERERSGIKTLRVGYNKIFGYFIEVPKSQKDKVPINYSRKQTLVNSERYITEELKEIENKIAVADDRAKAIEIEIFNSLIDATKEIYDALKEMSDSVAKIDFYNSLASFAREREYIRPKINEEGIVDIQDGFHPVVEQIEAEKFIRNDLVLNKDTNNVIILTGPNMAGKSTYLRQNALIILLSHIGSFVPAKYANISITDRIFTRIGAHDNLSLGLSTFMVEMIETANILNNATDKSFIILDEIGRGTSTYDGLSIAWSVLEYIYEKIGAKTLFATHYHQITDLEYKYGGIKNYYITAKENEGTIVFLRKVVRGSVDKSYGIAVAKLAGLPSEVIENAQIIEGELENNRALKKNIKRITIESSAGQKTLFDREE